MQKKQAAENLSEDEPDEEETDEEEDTEDECDGIVLTSDEANALSRYIEELLLLVKSDDFAVLRGLADRL